MNNKIEFTKEKYLSLKLLYEKAVLEGRDTIWFENNQLLVSYTKYLLQHLENVLGIKKND